MEQILDKQQILEKLTVTQKRDIIKNSDKLSEIFKNNADKALSKAKGEDIDNFINKLSSEDMKVFIDMSTAEIGNPDEAKDKAKKVKSSRKAETGESHDEDDNDDVTDKKGNNGVNSQATLIEENLEKTEREIPENILKKIFRDLYPTSIHKTKYIQENPSLKMSALTKGIFGKNVKKEDIDDFLIKQVPKNPKSMKQLSIDWIENKKGMKIDNANLLSENVSVDDIRETLKDISIEDFETYVYLMQSEISENVFDYIETIRAEEIRKRKESGDADTERVKELGSRLKTTESKLSEIEEKKRDEINSIRQNYENEKEKLKSKYEQRIETLKNKSEEEKVQLVKIQADSDRRFSEERKTFNEQVENLEKENKKLLDRLSNTSTDLLSQNKQYKDVSKELTRLQNRIEELQTENKDLASKNEEIKFDFEKLFDDITYYQKQETNLQKKVQELAVKIQELEKTKIAFLLNESELQSVVKELNSVDETKERMLQLLNIDTHHTKESDEDPENEDSNIKSLDDLWVRLIEQEEEIIADYLSVGTEDVATKELLKDKIDSLLDLEYNLKAREVLVKMLYEKGYKAYKNIK